MRVGLQPADPAWRPMCPVLHIHNRRHKHNKPSPPSAAVVSPAPGGAYFGGIPKKDQVWYEVKTSPKKPKANQKMTVKVKVRR